MVDVPMPPVDFSGSGPVEYAPQQEPKSGKAAVVLEREEARIMSTSGVTSVGIGHGPAGSDALVVGVTDAGVATRLPKEIDGVPVIVTVTGEVDALLRR